jgi:HSP20 family protein
MLLNHEPFADAFRMLDRLAGPAPGGMPMDIQRLDDRFLVSFDLPGVDPGSIDLTVAGPSLTVCAERTTRPAGGEWLAAECPRGTFTRRLQLGRDLDTERLDAIYVDGVLTLSIPLAERARPRRIEVTHGGRDTALVLDGTPD